MSGIRTNAITEKQNHKYKPLQRQQPLHDMYLLKVPPAWLYICPDATVGFPQLHLEICPDTRQGVLPFQSNFCPDPWLTLPYIIRGPHNCGSEHIYSMHTRHSVFGNLLKIEAPGGILVVLRGEGVLVDLRGGVFVVLWQGGVFVDQIRYSWRRGCF